MRFDIYQIKKLHLFVRVQTRMSFIAPHMLVASWNGYASPALQPPFPLPLIAVPPASNLLLVSTKLCPIIHLFKSDLFSE